MIGKVLINRIIEDLQNCLIASNNNRTLEEIKADILYNSGKVTKSKFDQYESYIAMSCEITIPYRASALLRLIIKFNNSVPVQKIDVFSLVELIDFFQKYKNILSESVQELADNKNFMFITEDSQEKIFDIIKGYFEDLHNESKNIVVAYSHQN